MEGLFTIEALGVLASLIFLQAVLGFDNLLYISIESRRAPEPRQAFVRRMGIGLAVALRLVLLFVVMSLIDAFAEPMITLQNFVITGEFNLRALIFLLGGAFIMYTSVKEISHLLSIDDLEHEHAGGAKSTAAVIAMIVSVNLIFSFDSILSMLPLTSQFEKSTQFVLMGAAVVVSGALMILLADRVAAFIQKNRTFEVLGLFVLLIVGVLLLGEGGHIAHMSLFGYPIEAMSKSTFYFSVVVLIVVDLVQSRYQRKLQARKRAEIKRAAQEETGHA